jgi:hypothetical protein
MCNREKQNKKSPAQQNKKEEKIIINKNKKFFFSSSVCNIDRFCVFTIIKTKNNQKNKWKKDQAKFKAG